ncbi:MAG: hypothetical protein WCF16_00460 [Alphaproteobacteria bacterium]
MRSTAIRALGLAAMVAAALAVVGAFPSPRAAAAEKTPQWRQELEFQLRKDFNCEVNYLSRVIVKNVGGDEAVLARAHCMDHRAFDVSRPGTGKPFDIKECTTLAC